jgi:hypothetical protein
LRRANTLSADNREITAAAQRPLRVSNRHALRPGGLQQVLAKNAPRDYAMPDGTVVTNDPTQPLPDTLSSRSRRRERLRSHHPRVAPPRSWPPTATTRLSF